jgi:hypothetical protein
MKWVVTTGGNGVIVEAETAFPSPSGVLLFYRRLAPDEPALDLDGDAPAPKPGARRGRFGPKKVSEEELPRARVRAGEVGRGC